jgi:hypothetical protein
MALRIRKDGLTQAELVQELSDESSLELSSDPKYQQLSVTDDDSLEKKSLPVATAVDEQSIV